MIYSRKLAQSLTPSIIVKLTKRVKAAFYLRYIYSFVIVKKKLSVARTRGSNFTDSL